MKRLLSADEREQMETVLAADPLAHPVIPGAGGFRKARWARGNRGKSGGVRTIYYYFVSGGAIFLEYIYGKNEKENLTREETNRLRQLSEQIERIGS